MENEALADVPLLGQLPDSLAFAIEMCTGEAHKPENGSSNAKRKAS